MSWMPVSVDMMFDDFKDTLIECQVVRNGETILNCSGMLNDENGKEYIMFRYGLDIQVGDIIFSEHGNDIVQSIVIGKYEGEPNAIEAYI